MLALRSFNAGGISTTIRGEATDVWFVDVFSTINSEYLRHYAQNGRPEYAFKNKAYLKPKARDWGEHVKHFGYKVMHVDVVTRKMTTVLSNPVGNQASKIFLDVAALVQSDTAVRLFTVQAPCTEVLDNKCHIGRL